MRVNASKVANFAVFFSVGIIAALLMRLKTTLSDLALQRQRIYYEELFASWFSQRGFNLVGTVLYLQITITVLQHSSSTCISP